MWGARLAHLAFHVMRRMLYILVDDPSLMASRRAQYDKSYSSDDAIRSFATESLGSEAIAK